MSISQQPVFKLNLFLIMESYKSAHPVMKDIIADAMSKRLEELLSNEVSIIFTQYVVTFSM